jgi:hypothetical protein
MGLSATKVYRLAAAVDVNDDAVNHRLIGRANCSLVSCLPRLSYVMVITKQLPTRNDGQRVGCTGISLSARWARQKDPVNKGICIGF